MSESDFWLDTFEYPDPFDLPTDAEVRGAMQHMRNSPSLNAWFRHTYSPPLVTHSVMPRDAPLTWPWEDAGYTRDWYEVAGIGSSSVCLVRGEGFVVRLDTHPNLIHIRVPRDVVRYRVRSNRERRQPLRYDTRQLSYTVGFNVVDWLSWDGRELSSLHDPNITPLTSKVAAFPVQGVYLPWSDHIEYVVMPMFRIPRREEYSHPVVVKRDTAVYRDGDSGYKTTTCDDCPSRWYDYIPCKDYIFLPLNLCRDCRLRDSKTAIGMPRIRDRKLDLWRRFEDIVNELFSELKGGWGLFNESRQYKVYRRRWVRAMALCVVEGPSLALDRWLAPYFAKDNARMFRGVKPSRRDRLMGIRDEVLWFSRGTKKWDEYQWLRRNVFRLMSKLSLPLVLHPLIFDYYCASDSYKLYP